MTNANADSANNTGLPSLSDLHTRAIYLEGLATVLQDFDAHDFRTSDGAGAVAYATESLAREIARDLEKLMDAAS